MPAERRRNSPNRLRLELVSVALRGTLSKHGVPVEWMTIEVQSALTPEGEYHSYVRVLLRQWEPAFLPYMVAFQNSLAKRVYLLDATAHSWLRSISWQFDVPDERVCAELPPPARWAVAAAPVATGPAPALETSVRAGDALEQLRHAFASNDVRQFGSADFEKTRPFAADEHPA